MANKKITIAEQFAEVEKFLRENGKGAMADFINERAELHAKRNGSKSSKPTKTQIANEELKTKIFNEMVEGVKYTVSDLIAKLPCCEGLSTQKLTPLMKALVSEGEVVRVEEKGKGYYSLA